MTTVKITLPDELAQEAERAGLLSARALEEMLREHLRLQNAQELFSAMERMSASGATRPMSPEEIAGEMASMRAERRVSRS